MKDNLPVSGSFNRNFWPNAITSWPRITVLKAGFGEDTPKQVSDRRHKKRGSGFLWQRSVLALSLPTRFFLLSTKTLFTLLRISNFVLMHLCMRISHQSHVLLCIRWIITMYEICMNRYGFRFLLLHLFTRLMSSVVINHTANYIYLM